MWRRAAAATTSAALSVQAVRFLSRERSDDHSAATAVTQFFMFDALRVAGALARASHDRDCRAFQETQAALLRGLLEKNKATAYGTDHGFGDMCAAEDVVAAFRRGHPVTTYADVEPYIQRIADGEANVINAEAETMLAATSGTSGKVALLPTTTAMRKAFFSRGILVVFDTLARLGHLDHLQRACKLTFLPNVRQAPGGLPVGPNSSNPRDASFQKLRPYLYSTPAAGYEISDDETAAMYVHALFAARDRKLGLLEANFCSLPARLLGMLESESWNRRIAADVEAGTLDGEMAARLGADRAQRLTEALGGPDPDRAAEIRAARASGVPADELEGAAAPEGEVGAAEAEATPVGEAPEGEAAPEGEPEGFARRLWPHLRLVLSNGTGAFAPVARRLRDGPGAGVPLLSTILAASEGLVGVGLEPAADGSSAYCLVPRAMFFEFVPVGGGDPQLAAELELGADYELVVTTLGGLCRYRLGDVVRPVGYHCGGAPVVEFRYRAGQVLNARGEKISEEQLQRAVDAAIPGATFAAALTTDDSEAPGYLVFAAGAKEPFGASAALEDELCALNPVYAGWRAKEAIAHARVLDVEVDAFEAFRDSKMRTASPHQWKQPRVLTRPDDIRFFLAHRKDEDPSPGTLGGVANWTRRYF